MSLSACLPQKCLADRSRNKGKSNKRSQGPVGCWSPCLGDEVKCLWQIPKRKEERRGKSMLSVTGVISLKCSLKNDLITESFGLILGGGETVIARMSVSVGSQVHRDRG